MAADPFGSMTDTLVRVADDVGVLIRSNNGRPVPGSQAAQAAQAAKECDDDPFRGEWGSPARSAAGALILSATSCHDHLQAARSCCEAAP
jgi:hypothetical protein